MPARTGSWPVLAAAAATFLLLFEVQRHRSSFLAIERERDAAGVLAQMYGLPVPDVLALRDLVGVNAPASAWRDAAAQFATTHVRYGDGLAAVFVAGGIEEPQQLIEKARTPDAAWELFRTDDRAVPGLRFLAMRERFASRAPARD